MTVTSAGAFDEFLDGIETGDAYYLRCPEGHGSLPPQRICPDCSSRALSKTPLPATGEVATYTVVSVPAPAFSDDSPYITAIAAFGSVNVTGQLRGIDPDTVEVGQQVSIDVATTSTTDDRVIVFSLDS